MNLLVQATFRIIDPFHTIDGMQKRMSENQMENIPFYNEIADNYDAIMDKEHSNGIVRRKVADKFLDRVAPGRVLDFGGGTGDDLGWLTDHGYQVIFCEPSTGMKELALSRYNSRIVSGHVEFLSGMAVDFTDWQKNLPFQPPVDAILANFAVINCIPDIGLLFRNLALVLKPGGSLVALVLRPKFLPTLRSFAGLAPNTQEVRYKDHRQTVYLHTIRAIRKASAAYFSFSSRESLQGSVFSLLHLTRK
jgi:SAM-dependent methyltransferase